MAILAKTNYAYYLIIEGKTAKDICLFLISKCPELFEQKDVCFQMDSGHFRMKIGDKTYEIMYEGSILLYSLDYKYILNISKEQFETEYVIAGETA